jgi:hypothetical protein
MLRSEESSSIELHVSGANTVNGRTVGFGNSQLRPETGIAWTLDNALKVAGYISPVKFEIINGVALSFGIGLREDQGAAARVGINGGATALLSDYLNYHTSVEKSRPSNPVRSFAGSRKRLV